MSKDEQIQQLSSENSLLTSENVYLKWELSQLKKLIYGSKSERKITIIPDEDQLYLFGEDPQEAGQEVEAEQKEIITYERENSTKTHPGRHPFPQHLPVEEVIIQPDYDITGLTKISEEVTETLDYTPASLVIKRVIRPKYAQSDGHGVLIAQLPSRALPKSIAEIGRAKS